MSHSAKAAQRGEPSYVWRAGQARRLAMLAAAAPLRGRLLDAGCGLGAYLEQAARYNVERYGFDVEYDRLLAARTRADGVTQAVGERLPYADDSFDVILSNEVIEHVEDDRLALAEMARVTRPGGRIVIFCPNRWYPVEQHGIYWRGSYRFGNQPLVNYLPDRWRNRLAPHVRVYTRRALLRLTRDLPLRIVSHRRIFGGYDNIIYRWPRIGRLLRAALYALEHTPLQRLGLSHVLVLEKLPTAAKLSRDINGQVRPLDAMIKRSGNGSG